MSGFKAITETDLKTPGPNNSKNNFIITFNELLEDLNIPLIPIPDFDMFIRVIYAGMNPTKIFADNSFQVFIDDRTNVQPVKKMLNIGRNSPLFNPLKLNGNMAAAAAPAAGGGRKKKSKNKSKYKNNIRKKTKNNIKKKFRSNTKKRKSLKNKNTLKASRNSSKRKRKNKTYQNLKGGGNGILSIFTGCMPKPDLVSFPLRREEEEEEEEVVKEAAQAIEELRLSLGEGEVSEEKISALKIKVGQAKKELRLPIGEVISALEIKVESKNDRINRGKTGVTEKEEEFDGLEAAPTSLPRKLFFSEDNKKLDIEDMSDARSEDKKNNERRLFKLYYMLESIVIPLFFKVAPLQHKKYNARIDKLGKLGKHNLHFCRTPNNTLGQYIYESTIYDILNYKLSNLPDKSLSKKVLDIYGYGILKKKDNLDFHIAKETDNKRQAHKVSSLHTDAQKLILPETIKERINIILNSFDDSDPYNYVSYQIVECDDHYITFKSLLGNTSFTEENAKLFLVSVAQTSVELYKKCGFVHFDLHGGNYLINKTELSGSIPKCKFFDFDLSMIKLPEDLFDKEQYYSHSQTAAYDAIRMLDLTGSNDQNKEDTVFLKIGHIFDICRLCSDNIIVRNQGSVWHLARSSLEWIIRVNYNKLSTLHEILIGNIVSNKGKRGGIIDLQTYIHSNTYDTNCIFTQEEYTTLVSIFTENEASIVPALNISNFKIFYKNKFIQCVIIALWCYLFNSKGEEAFFK